ILERIGAGGMGVVFKARQESMGREVALKVLPRLFFIHDDQTLERFDREVRIIAALQHPHILPVYDFGGVDGQPFIVMALMPGGSLQDAIKARGPLPIGEVLRFVRQVADALDYAHAQGIIHRDLKPANVLIDWQDNGRHNCYLADFGLATGSTGSRITESGAMVGTPAYMAPDWLEAERPSATVDVYALGVMLFEMLTADVPFHAETPMGTVLAHLSQPVPDVRVARPELPAEVVNVLAQALAKEPRDRFESAGALAAAFEDAMRQPADMRRTPVTAPIERRLYPNSWARAVLETAEGLLRKENLEALLIQADLSQYIDNYPPDNLKKAFPFEHMSRFFEAVYRVYGSRGAQSVGRLTGYRVFYNSVKRYESIARVAKLLMAAAPPDRRDWVGLEHFARFLNSLSDTGAQADEDEDYYIWRYTACPFCWGTTAKEPLGWVTVGFLQASFEWAGHSTPRVFEWKCQALGDEHGVWLIDKSTIDEPYLED
ncbi:MAG: protein kinase, partial [Chloroflexi bacterium]|nr:protein kinase [Chloroflexota bacterium]